MLKTSEHKVTVPIGDYVAMRGAYEQLEQVKSNLKIYFDFMNKKGLHIEGVLLDQEPTKCEISISSISTNTSICRVRFSEHLINKEE